MIRALCNYHHNCLTGKGRSSGRKIHQENESLNFFLSRWNKEFWFRLTLPYFFFILQMLCVCFHIFNLQMFTRFQCPPINHLFFSNYESWQMNFRFSLKAKMCFLTFLADFLSGFMHCFPWNQEWNIRQSVHYHLNLNMNNDSDILV